MDINFCEHKLYVHILHKNLFHENYEKFSSFLRKASLDFDSFIFANVYVRKNLSPWVYRDTMHVS